MITTIDSNNASAHGEVLGVMNRLHDVLKDLLDMHGVVNVTITRKDATVVFKLAPITLKSEGQRED